MHKWQCHYNELFETTKCGPGDDKVSRVIQTAGPAVPGWKKLVLTDPLDNSLLQTNSSKPILMKPAKCLKEKGWMDGWMNGVLGHFYALSRLNWAGDNLG